LGKGKRANPTSRQVVLELAIKKGVLIDSFYSSTRGGDVRSKAW